MIWIQQYLFYMYVVQLLPNKIMSETEKDGEKLFHYFQYIYGQLVSYRRNEIQATQKKTKFEFLL